MAYTRDILKPWKCPECSETTMLTRKSLTEPEEKRHCRDCYKLRSKAIPTGFMHEHVVFRLIIPMDIIHEFHLDDQYCIDALAQYAKVALTHRNNPESEKHLNEFKQQYIPEFRFQNIYVSKHAVEHYSTEDQEETGWTLCPDDWLEIEYIESDKPPLPFITVENIFSHVEQVKEEQEEKTTDKRVLDFLADDDEEEPLAKLDDSFFLIDPENETTDKPDLDLFDVDEDDEDAFIVDFEKINRKNYERVLDSPFAYRKRLYQLIDSVHIDISAEHLSTQDTSPQQHLINRICGLEEGYSRDDMLIRAIKKAASGETELDTEGYDLSAIANGEFG